MAPSVSAPTTTAEGKPLSHRDRLLRQGMRSFYALGFHGTTVDKILEAAQVPKGSFYHHFGSKESFAQAVLEQYMTFQLDLLAKWADRDDLTTLAKLEGYFDDLAARFVRSGFERACLAGKFSTELGASSETFRAQVSAGFVRWKNALITMFSEGQDRGDIRSDLAAESLATTVLVLLQGGFVLALSDHSDESLESVRATLAAVVSPSG